MSTRPLLLALVAPGLASCGEFPEDKDLFCGWAGLKVRDDQPTGDVRLRAYLHQDDGEPASLNVGYSLDEGLTWFPATIEGQTTELPSSADGESANLTWDSAADLGQGTADGVLLRVVAWSECGTWDDGVADPVTVENTSFEEGCTIDVETPGSPEDGPVVLDYTLTHPDSLPAYVAANWSIDGGETWAPLSVIEGDCDGDGLDDGQSDLETGPDGVSHCLHWDSQLDFSSDEEVMVELSCGVGYDEDSVATTAPFLVENDSTPDPDEVIVTEIMARSRASWGEYLELYNRTDHILNLQDVDVKWWPSDADPEVDDPEYSFTMSDPTESLLLYPGDTLLFVGSEEEEENGCLEPDLVWDSGFNLEFDGRIHLSLGRETLTVFDFVETAREWEFERGVALGLDPSAFDSDDWAEFDNWCAQTSEIPVCDGYDNINLGTPDAPNDACR